MKKIIMFLWVAIASISCSDDDKVTPPAAETNAMKIINKNTGAEIKDGDVVVFTTALAGANDANSLKFYFSNVSSAPIKVRSRFVSLSGVPNANNVQYCIGDNCLTSIAVGANYPVSNQEVLTVPANGKLGDIEQYKIQNFATPVAPATAVDYVFEFYQYDNNGNEVGNKVRFTYRYQQ
jgi:hypothetical protein